MKKTLLFFTLLATLCISGCNKQSNNNEESPSSSSGIDYAPIDKEIESSYNYFMATTNLKEGSPGFGLTQDRLTNASMASIAATGFLLGSYPVFVEQGLMDKETAKTYVSNTLDTIIRIQADSETSYAGCISHFVYRANGQRFQTSEVSTIDTAILVCGAITASEYFKGDLIEKANTIWGNVDYTKFVVTKNSKQYISMGVDQPEDGKQLSPWDYYAEQLMIYILGVGNPVASHRISSTFYKSITKNKNSYGQGDKYIYSWYGSLFTYQYSHAFFNFKMYNDYKGVNYFRNSVSASKAAYDYCQDRAEYFKTFSDSAWGLTACDTPLGYSGLLGTPPRGYAGNDVNYTRIEGTVAPTAAIGSLPFTPEESYRALANYLSIVPLNHPTYGIKDSYNLDFNGAEWYCSDIIGIDKGIEVMQLYNFKNTDFISNLAMQNENVIRGFVDNDFVEVDNGVQE